MTRSWADWPVIGSTASGPPSHPTRSVTGFGEAEGEAEEEGEEDGELQGAVALAEASGVSETSTEGEDPLPLASKGAPHASDRSSAPAATALARDSRLHARRGRCVRVCRAVVSPFLKEDASGARLAVRHEGRDDDA